MGGGRGLSLLFNFFLYLPQCVYFLWFYVTLITTALDVKSIPIIVFTVENNWKGQYFIEIIFLIKKKLKKNRTNKQIQQTYVWKNYPIEVLLYRRNKICCIKTDVKYGYTETDYVGYNFGPKSVLENYL